MSGTVEYLVTGGAGFIGSHLVRRLLDGGSSVRVIDNFLTGKRENLSDLLAHPGLDLVEADIRNASMVREAAEGARFVLHQAALPSVPRSVAIRPPPCPSALTGP
ncbi:MAG: NAD-dependent epimerase/dehydratase family protein [Acidobacteriota bacterium]